MEMESEIISNREKKLSHLWSIVEKLPNNDQETSLTIIVLRGPFKRKCESEDVKSNLSPVLAQTELWNSEWRCLINLGCFVNQVFDGG